jgi:hypothetical protein
LEASTPVGPAPPPRKRRQTRQPNAVHPGTPDPDAWIDIEIEPAGRGDEDRGPLPGEPGDARGAGDQADNDMAGREGPDVMYAPGGGRSDADRAGGPSERSSTLQEDPDAIHILEEEEEEDDASTIW